MFLYNYIINSIKEIRNDMEILKNRFNQIQNALILAKTDEEYYEWVEKNSGELIHLITNGNANVQNSIRVKSKTKK